MCEEAIAVDKIKPREESNTAIVLNGCNSNQLLMTYLYTHRLSISQPSSVRPLFTVDDDQHRDSRLVKVQGIEACRISALNGTCILYAPPEGSGIIKKEEPGRL